MWFCLIWDIYARIGKKDGQLFATHSFTNSSSSKAIPNLQSNSERPLKPQKEPEKQPEKPKKPEKPEKSEKKIQVNYKTKPFGQLMSDVVFTISGTYLLDTI